jgi:glycosyltransferase involved in cell wall biosynthesis
LPYKDPAATIRAFGALDDSSVRLYVSGDVTAPTQDAVDLLPDRIRRQVTLLGQVDGDSIRSLHGRVRVAAFPTRYAIPVASATVMEAVASATPIVGSARLSRDVLADGFNGIVVDASPSAMAAALKAVLNDDALWCRLSARAQRMAERFDAIRVAGQYIELASARDSQHLHRFPWDASRKSGKAARARAE